MESVGNIIVYCVVALVIICGSIYTVTSRNLVRAATSLLMVLFATAVIYFQMDYEFLGAVQIAVYAGGIMVLIVFAILLTHDPSEPSKRLDHYDRWKGILAGLATLAVVGIGVITCFMHKGMDWVELTGDQQVNIERIGHWLLSTDKFGYLLPFEAVSVLLLACIIGGVVIARRR